MNSIGAECTELKHIYDECFNKWYASDFLKGDLTQHPCQELFEEYKACVLVTVRGKRLDTLLQGARRDGSKLYGKDIKGEATDDKNDAK